MSDCLFCKIIRKEIPSSSVYEDEDVYAFLDIHPVNNGHVLVVPKRHSDGMHDAAKEDLERLIVATQRVAAGVIEGLDAQGYNFQQNNGAAAGQVIPHLHFHIIPRFEDDGLRLWPGHDYGEGEMEEVARKIRTNV